MRATRVLRAATALAILAAAVACRTPSTRATAQHGTGTAPLVDPTPSHNAESLPSPAASGSASASALRRRRDEPPALRPTPPPLKPVNGKPFPEGVSEATVCEAVDSKEPDLWLRFGHLLPLYGQGAIYVLQAGREREAAIEQFIRHDYLPPSYTQQASCGDKTLLYVRNLFEESMWGKQPFGRLHLSGELEKHFGVKTVESFIVNAENKRLADYCRADADVCDALLKLNSADGGEGVCRGAVRLCTRTERGDIEYDRLFKVCIQFPKAKVACRAYAHSVSEGAICRAEIRRLLCPSN